MKTVKRAGKVLKNYFIPHEENEFMPRVLRPHAIAMVCLVVIVAESLFIFGHTIIVPQSKLFGVIEVNALIDETNESRTSNDMPALTVSPLLQAAAQEKADDMATKGYFAHTSPQGLTPWYWFENVGYSFSYAGENLAVNFSDSQDVTNAWMNSAEHRANILSSDFTQIGIATAQGVFNGQAATYVVEEFGTPAASPVAFVNTASAASVPTTAPIPTVVVAAKKKNSNNQSATNPKAIATASPKPASPKPVAPIAVIPAIVPIQATTSTAPATTTSSTAPIVVGVKGASTEGDGIAVVPVATAAIEPASGNGVAPAPASNLIQMLLSDPRQLTNDFYLFLMLLFAIALFLNIFIKIRIQYPRLIAGGLAVIVVAGLCIMLNQNIALFHAAIL